MTEILSSGSEEPQSDDSQETGHREPEKGDSPNPKMGKITFGELLKLAQARKGPVTFSSWYDEPGTSELKTSQPKQRTVPSTASDPSKTTWEVLMIPKKRRGTTRHASSQNSSADPQQQAQE